MEIKLISSENNSIIKHIKSLQLKKQRVRHLQFTVEGVRIVEECLKHNGDIEYVIFSEELHQVQGGSDLLNKVSSKGHTIYQLPSQLFSKLATTESPQGIMAVVNMKNSSLEDLKFEDVDNLFFVILDRIQDPGNMGTIIRTAESAKVDAVIITKGSVDPYNSKTLRATMGAIFHLPIIQCDNDVWIEYLKQKNVELIAADLDTDKTYIDIDYNKNIGIVIGNEANGINSNILSSVDERVIIPILGKIESLNASVAAGILIYKAAEEKHLRKV
ncbi:23S rRNA (guanosine(2251)-2'-O)-methyltransferase RlmB [Alkaliphilus sp. MSJ-5]|uniref:23S rRNA (Guanosine(2251)-2'-O)-methyltransferase RlmB n=2 Tax=Alkaliphilus flagellatus TaxID=2841507 RepID=A0ABS6G3D4_9FIRM|nr:23S rRNA (guanosine(2251)-2'-O)-methyltransferase RlmB [Alkaliphilus flagellatus]